MILLERQLIWLQNYFKFLNKNKEFCYKIDFWSIGCVIYEMMFLEKFNNGMS